MLASGRTTLLFSFSWVLLGWSSVVRAATVVRHIDVVNGDVNPDGYARPAVLADGQFPGPIITGNKGDSFEITIKNSLADERLDTVTTVHWHGIDQRRSNWADGVDAVTQCPIIPGNSFTYQFNTFDQAGTFWYHSHYANQYCDGLRGALILYDPNDPQKVLYDVDDESTIITLSDWYHYLSHDSPVVAAPSSTLINGIGRYAGGPKAPLAVINVKPLVRYRFRLVSMSCDPNFLFSIDHHLLTIIEADGNSVQPHEVMQIQIFAAQRYSFVLTADKPVENYWIRAIPNAAGASIDGGINAAILRYAGANEEEPTSNDTSALAPGLLSEYNLHPLVHSPPPTVADEEINLDVRFNRSMVKYFVNDEIFEMPPVPVLLQILSGAKSASDLLPSNSIHGLEPNKTYDVIVPAGAQGGPHPLHLHGHAFWVIQSAGSESQNTQNPVLRDVTNLGNPGDKVRIRFRTDNPGPWFLHCHINWHLGYGFAIIFAENVPGVAETTNPSQAWHDLCPAYERYKNKHKEERLNPSRRRSHTPRLGKSH